MSLNTSTEVSVSKLLRPFALAAVLAALCGVPTIADAQDEAPAGEDAAAALDAYAKLAEPGPEHEKLKQLVGSWSVVGSMSMGPDAEPMRTEAKATIRPVFGGRYFRETYEGEFFGAKFTGIGIYGFDKGYKKYVSTWMDSMSTGIMHSEGVANEAGDTITYTGEYFDPLRQTVVKSKIVVVIKSRMTHTSTMYEILPGGKEQKTMELVYTRVKAEKKAKNSPRAAGGAGEAGVDSAPKKAKKETAKRAE